MDEALKKYIEIRGYIKEGMKVKDAAIKGGYKDNKGYEKMRERLKAKGLVNEAGDVISGVQKPTDTNTPITFITPKITVSKPSKKQKYRYQVFLSDPVRELLEKECNLEGTKVVQKIAQICTEYYKQKYQITGTKTKIAIIEDD